MPRPDLLDADAIRAGLAAQGETFAVEVRERCASTNTELLARGTAGHPQLLLADEQTAGRGRRGRRWLAPPHSALMFSLRWEFAGPVARLRGLPLAVGVGIARALRAMGVSGVALKWPNDLMAGAGKLGGVLIETRTSARGAVAVIGVGLNWRRQPGLAALLRRPVAALEEHVQPLPSRNRIAVQVVAELARTLRAFDGAGLDAFRRAWESLHAQQGEHLRVRIADGRVVQGIAEGIAADGALLLRNRRGLRAITTGSIVRAPSPRAEAA